MRDEANLARAYAALSGAIAAGVNPYVGWQAEARIGLAALESLLYPPTCPGCPECGAWDTYWDDREPELARFRVFGGTRRQVPTPLALSSLLDNRGGPGRYARHRGRGIKRAARRLERREGRRLILFA